MKTPLPCAGTWLRVTALPSLALLGLLSAAGHAAGSSGTTCALVPGVPAPPANAQTIAPGTAADDTTRIQQTLDQLKGGTWLVFQPGTYHISQHLNVGVSGVTLYGAGATLQATSPSDGALMIEGDNVAVYGFTTNQASTGRLSTPWAGGISVYDDRSGQPRRVQGVVIQNNTVNNSAAVGIFMYKASGFTIANNIVYRSWADGIHMTGGSRDGRVIKNKVRQTGDDMVAVVSYAGLRGTMAASVRYANWTGQQDELDEDIYVGGNDVSDQYWGRGISVVGGSDVTIENNAISKTAIGAGIYLTRETSSVTFGDHNILVRNNQISHVQTDAPTYMPPGFQPTQTHQGGIEIAAQMFADDVTNPIYAAAFSTNTIAILGNQISNTQYDGIRAGIYSPDNSVSQLMVQNNVLTAVGNTSIVDEYPGLAAASTVCAGNTLAGAAWGAQCVTTVPPVTMTSAVSGASLQCDASGRIQPSVPSRPQPPGALKAK